MSKKLKTRHPYTMISFFWYNIIIESRSGANDNILFLIFLVIPSKIVIPPELLVLSYELLIYIPCFRPMHLVIHNFVPILMILALLVILIQHEITFL